MAEKVTEMQKPSDRSGGVPNLICPHCGADPMNVGVRFIPFGPNLHMVVSGCLNPECRCALGTQICPNAMLQGLLAAPAGAPGSLIV